MRMKKAGQPTSLCRTRVCLYGYHCARASQRVSHHICFENCFSGIDLDVSGPLVGTDSEGNPSRCNIQNYLAIEGMCGWHSNHNSNVPWVEAVDICGPFRGEESLRAVRMSALSTLTLNTIATEMSLPSGGYGLTGKSLTNLLRRRFPALTLIAMFLEISLGVCNDTAAVIEYAMRCVRPLTQPVPFVPVTYHFLSIYACRGSTNVYPITYSGRFMMHTARVSMRLRKIMSADPNMSKEVDCLGDLLKAMLNLPNDQQATPAEAKDAVKRMLIMMPPFVHQLTLDAKEIAEEMHSELEAFSSSE
jgi:hypothetical protein